MIPMKSSSMTMAMISLFRKGISSADFCLPESSFYLSVFGPVEAVEYFSDAPPVLGFWEDDIHEGALAGVDQGSHTTWLCGLAWPAPRCGLGPWYPTSASPSSYLHHLAK
jgi:hypothetical protein